MANRFIIAVIVILYSLDPCTLIAHSGRDWRNICNGNEIPSEGYADQPYVVKTDDGAWLCVLTTGAGKEGTMGQHIITTRSLDQGKTWSDPVDVEPASGPEASYAVLLKIPTGRIFTFYNHNTDNIRKIKADNPPYKDGYCRRVDSQGYFVFKYSDDDGRSWSKKRTAIPVREFAIDRQNPYSGTIRFFWNVGKPFIYDGAAFVPLHKVGGIGHGFFTCNEGVLLKSNNLLTERDSQKIAWETLPDGDIGLRTPPGGGPISAEQSFSVLSDGSFYCVYRTIDGHPVFTYSRDRGHSWEPPKYKRFADGRLVKHPRAANFAWKCSNGKYLYWFHNHGGNWYDGRNPAWLCGGIEFDSPVGKVIKWSQPEIVLYDDDPYVRISYPDFIEDNGRFFLTETQKEKARVHEIETGLVEDLWRQFNITTVANDGLIITLPGRDRTMPDSIAVPPLPIFLKRNSERLDYGTLDLRQGFSVEVWFILKTLKQGQVLVDNRTPSGKGFCLQTTAKATVEIVLNDGRTQNRWDCDPGMLETGTPQHLVAIIDGGPKIISFIVQGKFCDGGEYRQFGWGRFSPNLRSVNGAKTMRIAPHLDGEIMRLRIYNRALRTSEAIGNFRAGI